MEKVYVIGRIKEDGSPWEIMGIYTDRLEAEKVSDATKDCIDCIMELEVNVRFPEETIRTGYYTDRVIEKNRMLEEG